MNDFINIDTLAERVAAKVREIPLKRVMNVEEAAQYLGITVDALRHKVYCSKVPTVKIDSRMFFDRFDLDKLIENSKQQGIA
jgi:hypothetical protein